MKATLLSCLLACVVTTAHVGDRAAIVSDNRQSWDERRWVTWISTVAYNGAPTEQRTATGLRCDILLDDLAVEVDWAEKWQEGIGQALYYSIAFDRRPALLLLWRDAGDETHHLRSQVVCAKYGIRLIAVKTWKANPLEH